MPSSNRAAALTALFFYTIFAVIAFWAEGKQARGHLAEAAE
jgi:hypothetical protein